MNSNIANVIEINSLSAKYDASVKEMLADKQILARILKNTMEEFANKSILKHRRVPIHQSLVII